MRAPEIYSCNSKGDIDLSDKFFPSQCAAWLLNSSIEHFACILVLSPEVRGCASTTVNTLDQFELAERIGVRRAQCETFSTTTLLSREGNEATTVGSWKDGSILKTDVACLRLHNRYLYNRKGQENKCLQLLLSAFTRSMCAPGPEKKSNDILTIEKGVGREAPSIVRTGGIPPRP